MLAGNSLKMCIGAGFEISSTLVISYDLYPEKPVEAEIKRNLFNWTSIIPPYIMCNGDLTIGVPMLLRYLADSSREFQLEGKILNNETRTFPELKGPKTVYSGPRLSPGRKPFKNQRKLAHGAIQATRTVSQTDKVDLQLIRKLGYNLVKVQFY